MISSGEVVAVILGGGRGTRLHPLTEKRSKPAVPIAGKYRLIDVPISNCIHSRIFRIAVLTQFNSVSLHRHIQSTYKFDQFHDSWVEILAAEQTPESSSGWYQGTADAVRKQLSELRHFGARYTLILAGDHLYRMDYRKLAEYHDTIDAQITVAVRPISAEDAGRFGVLKRAESGRITAFAEKPKDPVVLKDMISREDPATPYLGSLGFYFFDTDVLIELLKNPAWSDFGSDILPAALKTHRVYGYDFAGFWEDIGTIRSFYDTNLALTGPKPVFDFFDPECPVYTHQRFLPGSLIEGSTLERVMLCEGCRIQKARISDSIVGVRSRVGAGARIRDSILMGSDHYENEGRAVPLGIGPGCDIQGAIIDKNARIGPGVVIRPYPRSTPDIDTANWYVREGVVIIPKGGVVEEGTRIAPANL